MAKKNRKEKELSRLRREIEILKAQNSGQNYDQPKPRKEEKVITSTPPPAVASAGAAPKPLKALEIRRVDPKYIKKDLLKTALLSVLAFAIILVLYLIRSQIPFL